MEDTINFKENIKKVNKKTLTVLMVLVFGLSYFLGSQIIFPNLSLFNTAQVAPPAPIVSNSFVANITQTHATALWDTAIPADTQILLGPTAQTVVLQPAFDTGGVLVHRYEINGLTPCTRYWIRLRSTTSLGGWAGTSAYAFDTHGCQAVSTGDAVPPNTVSNIQITNVTPTSVTLSWPPVNPNGGTITKYYIFGGFSDIGSKGIRGNISGSQLTNPSFTVNNLTTGIYTSEYGARAGFRIQAVDSADNYSEMNTPLSVTIPDASSIMPNTMTTVQPNTWSATTLSVAFTCAMGNGTSCTGTYYKFVSVGTACPAVGSGYTAGTTATTSTEGAYTLCYYSTAAGGTETPKTLSPIGIDKTKPTGQIIFPSAYSGVKGTITVTTNVADTLSGVDHVDLKYDGDSVIGTTSQSPYSFTFDALTHTGYHRLLITAYDKVGNNATSSSIYFDGCENLSTTGALWSVQANGTGEPTGGGKCYGTVVTQGQATTVVTTRTALLSALSSAQSGAVIFIPGNVSIDLTGVHDILIPAGVTLASDRGYNGSLGALLFSNSWYTEGPTNAPLLKSSGDNIRITGLRIRGPSPDPHGRNFTAEGVAMMYWNNNNGTEIDNNEIYAWNKWAIYSQKIGDPGIHIHHNYFHDSNLLGYGYHIWLGGQGGGTNSGKTALVEANVFGPSREVIDANSETLSLIFRNNIITEGHFFTQTNQHPGANCFSGMNWSLRNNLFMSPGTPSLEKTPPITADGVVEVINNWFSDSYINDTTGAHEIPGTFWGCLGTSYYGSTAQAGDSRFHVSSNHIDGEGRSLPTAVISASATTIAEGQSVTFNGANSYDSTGVKIMNYRFRFADGTGGFNGGTNDQGYRQNEIWGKRSVTYPFTRAGYYDVELVAYNSYGVPSEPVYSHIKVNPAAGTGTHVLTAWIKDSYDLTALPGRYQKQLIAFDTGLTNLVVLWSSDVNGEQGWEYARVNLDTVPGLNITAGTQKYIGYRLIATGEPVGALGTEGEIWTWVDDIYVSGTAVGGAILDPGFENLNSYTTPWRQNPGTLSSAYIAEMSRGGKGSYRLRLGTGGLPVGTAGWVYQTVTFQ